MKKKSMLLVASLAGFITIWTIGCNDQPSSTSKNNQADSASLVKRGEYLVSTTGCDDCHSPKKMGPMGPELIPELRLSGHPENVALPSVDTSVVGKGWALFAPGQTATVGPWGASYAGNITSDATGIGGWTEEQFMNCIKKGIFKGLEGNRPLLPPMPWYVMKNMTDEDLKAIFYFLKTTKPVKNVVPSTKPLSQL